MSEVVVSASGLCKTYTRAQYRVEALNNVSLNVTHGEFVALMGPSGSGKSTLLHIMAGIDRPTAGYIEVLGTDLTTLREDRLCVWRNIHVGFVFQSFNLVPVLTALENVELPLKLVRLSRKERYEHAAAALEIVGLGDRMHHYPRQLSGGQEQRVAVARAIVTDPNLILADEPTGNLDAASARDVLLLLQKLNAEYGKTTVMVTHDHEAARFATTIHRLEKGVLQEDIGVPAGARFTHQAVDSFPD